MAFDVLSAEKTLESIVGPSHEVLVRREQPEYIFSLLTPELREEQRLAALTGQEPYTGHTIVSYHPGTGVAVYDDAIMECLLSEPQRKSIELALPELFERPHVQRSPSQGTLMERMLHRVCCGTAATEPVRSEQPVNEYVLPSTPEIIEFAETSQFSWQMIRGAETLFDCSEREYVHVFNRKPSEALVLYGVLNKPPQVLLKKDANGIMQLSEESSKRQGVPERITQNLHMLVGSRPVTYVHELL